jgi:hypothetical protein
MNPVCKMCNIFCKNYPGLVLGCMKKQSNQNITNNYKIVTINNFNLKKNYNKNKLLIIDKKIDEMVI